MLCILSKNWRHNWCRLSQLKLDQTLRETTDEFISPTVRFTNVFYHILALHAGPISKFILSIVDPVDCPKIDILIYFLSRSGIQHLVLQLPTGYNVYKLPSSFFTCLQLRHLTLQRCLVRPPPVFRGLISLELSQVTISTEDFGNFISRCLLLEHLVLDHSDNANNIEINAPKLRSFVFSDNIHLKCVPLLAKVSHESMESSVKARNYDLVAFFKSIPALEHLHWDYRPGEVQTKLPSALKCLKRLYLSELCFDELVEVAWALCLLRSSPYLKELEIKGPGDLSGELIDYVPWWTVDEIPASFSDVTYNYLRTVKIKGVVGAGVDMLSRFYWPNLQCC
ncbi:hypothetical protein KY289_003117 [Solanum tuberosum]|nr:hypothetical protein KY289_003117 [Solanum tuberosum]